MTLRHRTKLIIFLSTLVLALLSSGLAFASANGSHLAHTAHTSHVAHSNHNPPHRPVTVPAQCGAIAKSVTTGMYIGCVKAPTTQLQPLSGSPATGNTPCGAIGHIIGSSQQVGCVTTPRPQFGVIQWTAQGAAQSPVYSLPAQFSFSYICDGGQLTYSVIDTTGQIAVGGMIEKRTVICDNQWHTKTFHLSSGDLIQFAVDRAAIMQIGE